MKVGLALAGGGIKGVAHAGALQALEENGINIDIIGGTSSGAIVATLYSIGYKPKEIYDIFKKYAKVIVGIKRKRIVKGLREIIFKRKLDLKGLNTGKDLEQIFENIIKEKKCNNIQDIKNIKIVIPTFNLIKEQKCIFTNYNESIKILSKSHKTEYIQDIEISKAVRASSSFPGIFSPCKYNEYVFLDGGVVDNVPAQEIKKIGADKIITINFQENNLTGKYNVLEITNKTIDVMCEIINKKNLEISDVVIPINTNNTGLLDIKKIEQCYAAGYIATIKKIQEIKMQIRQEKEKVV